MWRSSAWASWAIPWPATWPRRATRHRLQPHRAPRPQVGRPSSAARRRRRRPRPPRAPSFVFACVGNDDDLRAVTTRRRRRLRAAWATGAVFVDHTTASAEVARELRRAAPRRAACGFIDAPVSGGQAGAENGVLDRDVRRRARRPSTRVEPVIDAYARAVTPDGRRRAPASSPRWSTRSASPALVQGLSEGMNFAPAGRPRRAAGARRHLQGRGAVLADGQPRQDHGRGRVRVRLRGRLDAQGPRHLPRRGASATARGCR